MKEEERHYPEVKEGIFRNDEWWVHCSCGYSAGPFPRKLEADIDADEHVIAITHT